MAINNKDNKDNKLNGKLNGKINSKPSNKQNNEKTGESRIKKSRNLWKVLAIVFVAMFVVIMTMGLLRSHKFREPPLELTSKQIEMVKSAALSSMNGKGNAISNYTISTPGVAREIEGSNEKHNVTEVAIYNSTTRDMYIIDINTGKILIYSKMEFFDGLTNFNDNNGMNGRGDRAVPPGPPGERRLFGR